MRFKSWLYSVVLFILGAYIWKMSNRGASYESNFGVITDEEFYIKVDKKIFRKEVDSVMRINGNQR